MVVLLEDPLELVVRAPWWIPDADHDHASQGAGAVAEEATSAAAVDDGLVARFGSYWLAMAGLVCEEDRHEAEMFAAGHPCRAASKDG